MAASKPVVASMWGGPSDVVEDGVTGFLVNPLQVGALAQRLERVLLDQDLAKALGRAGRARFEERFSLQAQLDATLRLYRDLGVPES